LKTNLFDGFLINLQENEDCCNAWFESAPSISASGNTPEEAIQALKIVWEQAKREWTNLDELAEEQWIWELSEGLYYTLPDNSKAVKNFLADHPDIRYCFKIYQSGPTIWMFSKSEKDLLHYLAKFDWDKNTVSSTSFLWEEYINFTSWLKEKKGAYKYDISGLLNCISVYILENENFGRLYNLSENIGQFNKTLKYMEEMEDFDWDSHDRAMDEEHHQYEKEVAFEKKLEEVGKALSREICALYKADFSLLTDLIQQYKDEYIAHDLYEQKLSYISRLPKKSAAEAIFSIGKKHKINNKDALSSPEYINEIVEAYKKSAEYYLLKGWDHFLCILAMFRNKTENELHKLRLDKALNEQRERFNKRVSLCPDFFHMPTSL